MNKCTYVQQKLGVCTFAELWQNLRNCVLFCRLPTNCHSPYKKYLQGLENFSQFGIIQTVIILLAIGNHSEVAHIQSAQLSVWHCNVPTLQMLCQKATRFVDITHKFFGFRCLQAAVSPSQERNICNAIATPGSKTILPFGTKKSCNVLHFLRLFTEKQTKFW